MTPTKIVSEHLILLERIRITTGKCLETGDYDRALDFLREAAEVADNLVNFLNGHEAQFAGTLVQVKTQIIDINDLIKVAEDHLK